MRTESAGRTNPRTSSVLRTGTWNVRYFPDGADPRSAPRPTNLNWLACALAWMDADVFVLQEIQSSERALAAVSDVVNHLNELTHGRWRMDIDDCYRGPNGQHEAILHDEARVTLSEPRHIGWDEQASAGNACGMGRRSAWTARVNASTGRVVRLVGVHAKSGEDASSFSTRQGAVAQLANIVMDARGSHPNDPVIVAGDFNTMGCGKGCAAPVKGSEEIRRLEASAVAARLWHIPSGRSCSYMDDHLTGLLDHFLVSDALTAVSSPVTWVSGLCGELNCETGGGVSKLRAWRELSDHCPVLMNIATP